MRGTKQEMSCKGRNEKEGRRRGTSMKEVMPTLGEEEPGSGGVKTPNSEADRGRGRRRGCSAMDG